MLAVIVGTVIMIIILGDLDIRTEIRMLRAGLLTKISAQVKIFGSM